MRSQSRHLEEVKCWNVALMTLTIALSFMRVIDGGIVHDVVRCWGWLVGCKLGMIFGGHAWWRLYDWIWERGKWLTAAKIFAEAFAHNKSAAVQVSSHSRGPGLTGSTQPN